MKKYFIIIIFFFINFPVTAYDDKEIKFKQKVINVKEKWNFSQEGTVQRFELRHGDAVKKQTPDSQRIELSHLPKNFCGGKGGNKQNFSKCKNRWAVLDLKVPGDFPSTDYQGIVQTSKLYILQMKTSTSLPLWSLNLNKGGTELLMKLNDSKNRCNPVSIEKEKWNQIVVYSNSGQKNKDKYFRFWVNGKEIGCMNSQFPFVVRKEAIKAVHKKGTTVSWGMYRTSLTKYLTKFNKIIPDKVEKVCPSKKWENKSCAIKRPFDYKWEVKIPTVILYFDNVYVGDELPNKITLENYN
jgi:hypothetical protein